MIVSTKYIIGHYNPSVRIINSVFRTTYVVCINFIHKWQDKQFKVDSERQIFVRNFSLQFYLLSEFLPEICLEEIAEEILFVFCFNVWPWGSNPSFTFIKPTHYLLDYGDFNNIFFYFILVEKISSKKVCEKMENNSMLEKLLLVCNGKAELLRLAEATFDSKVASLRRRRKKNLIILKSLQKNG